MDRLQLPTEPCEVGSSHTLMDNTSAHKESIEILRHVLIPSIGAKSNEFMTTEIFSKMKKFIEA